MLEATEARPIGATGDQPIQPLITLALSGLTSMFYRERNLFCYRATRTSNGMEKEGLSHRYTVMCLLGLNRAVAAGLRSPIDRAVVRAALGADKNWITNIGDLGLYLWLLAMDCPEELEGAINDLKVLRALETYSDVGERRTMELAWFLSGLAHVRLAAVPGLPDLGPIAFQTYQMLTENQGPHGFFGHQVCRGAIGRFRGRIGSFADQVYPIYALGTFARAYESPEALDRARRCAESICSVQGPLGQWWWHYNSKTGRVAGKHPVFAVHQDAMAPMALLPLSDATGRDFNCFVFRGLDWISGGNELNLDLRDFKRNLVWRCLYQTRRKAIVNELLRRVRMPTSPDGLRVKYEDRPYHLGWVLYAFAPEMWRKRKR
jgi:hypothetical protein